MARLSVGVTGQTLYLVNSGGGLKALSEILDRVKGVVAAKPRSPEEMIRQIGTVADETLWSQISQDAFNLGFMNREARGVVFWVSTAKDFQVFVHGKDKTGPVQFWAGRLGELTREGRTYDKLCGSARRISVEEVTEQFMSSLSGVR